MIKSKKTTIKLLICVLALCMLATVLVACNIGTQPAHYDWLVTFEYNIGNLSGSAPTQRLGVFDNSLISIRPGYKPSNGDKFEEQVIPGYYFAGWYLPVLDADGNPKKDENGFVELGREWRFDRDRVTENITLYGKFQKKLAVRFKNRATDEYITGSNVSIDCVPDSNVYEPTTRSAPRMPGYTFLGKYYTSIDGQNEVKWPLHVDDDNVDVYVDFIEGTWNLVSKESDFVLAMRSNSNIYLQNDLDFGKFYEDDLWGRTEYTGIINGNGHKVSNISRDITASRQDTDYFGGVFGALGATANIYDITFENVSLKFKINETFTTNEIDKTVDAYVGLLAGRTSEGAKLENVKIIGELSYKVYEPQENHPIHAGVIGDNKAKPEDIKGCNFDSDEDIKIEVA